MKHVILALTLFGASIIACSTQENTTDEVKEVDQRDKEGEQLYIDVYDNGQPKIKGMMTNGKREGLWLSFYENGVRWSEENYLEGKREGRTINFYKNGLIRYRGQFINDEKVGLWQFYNEEGKLVKEETF